MKANKILLVFIIILLSGCQPTPDQNIVVKKVDGPLQQAIDATPIPEQSIQLTPQTENWTEEIAPYDSDVKININATIEIPLVVNYPVYKTTPHKFTIEEVKKYVDYFIQGQPIYIYQNVETKSDILEEILQIKAQIEGAKTKEFRSEEERGFYINNLKEDLNIYEKRYENAPVEEPELKPALLEFNTVEEGPESYKKIMIQADRGKDRMATFGVNVYSNNLNNSMGFHNFETNTRYSGGFEATDTLAGLTTTLEEAKKTAEKTLDNLGILNRQITTTEVQVDITGLETQDEIKNAVNDFNRKKCYTFYFSSEINGIAITDFEPCYGIQGDDNNNVNYNEIWEQEELSISIDDTGVIDFRWVYPGDTDELLNSNVEVLNLEEIKKIFKDQISYQRSWTTSGYSNSTISIKSVQLDYMRIRIRDEEAYMLIPVWDFIGDWSYTVNTIDTEGNNSSTINSCNGVSFLTVNAIDGSIVNRYLGY